MISNPLNRDGMKTFVVYAIIVVFMALLGVHFRVIDREANRAVEGICKYFCHNCFIQGRRKQINHTIGLRINDGIIREK